MNKDELKAHLNKVANEWEIAPEKFFLAKLFDLKFTYNGDTCTVTMPVHEFMYNPGGIVHGGVISFLADTTMGHLTVRDGEGLWVSLEFKTSFMKAVKAGTLHARAWYRRKGRKVAFLDCIVTNENGEEIAQMTSTYYKM